MAASLRFPPWGKAAEGARWDPRADGGSPQELKMLRNLLCPIEGEERFCERKTPR